MSNLNPTQFRDISASELQVGHFLDSGRKSRVSKTHVRGDKVLAQSMRRGARSPGVHEWGSDDTVRVWERKQ